MFNAGLHRLAVTIGLRGRKPVAGPAAREIGLWNTPPHEIAAAFSVLQTGRGNLLSGSTPLVGMQDGLQGGDALVCVRPHANRQVVFLMSAHLAPVEIRDDGLRATAVSAFVVQGRSSQAWRLRHPFAPGRFLAVTEMGQGAPGGCVIFNSLGQSALDLFTPLPLAAGVIAPALVEAAAELCAAAGRPMTAQAVLDRVAQGQLRAGLIEAVLRVLPRDELAVLARRLMEDAGLLALLAGHLPGHAWFARVLPNLAAWERSRAPVPGHAMASPIADEFAGDGLEGHGQVQAGMAVTALARATIRPRQTACLLACARNEGPYLLEWLAYHRSVGFAHAFIYTNDNLDASGTLLGALARAGEVTVIDNQVGQHFGPQYKAHAHALTLLPQILDYRWCAVLDIDEYFGFDRAMFAGVQDYLAWQETQPVDAIALCWQLFAAMPGDVWRDDFTPARFTRRESAAHYIVKSIFRPQLFWHAQPHFPYSTLDAPFVYRTEAGALHHHAGLAGRPAAHAERPSAEYAWVNHYILRSAPEALWKLARGHADWSGDVAQADGGLARKQAELAAFVCRTFVNLAGKADLVEDRRILACAGGLQAELARLRALPGVGEAEALIKDGFAANLARVARSFVASGSRPGEPATVGEFRGIVARCLEMQGR